MGWKAGTGLGKSGHGVVNPLEQKLRPNSMGLGYGGFKETTAKAKLQQARILHGEQIPGADADGGSDTGAGETGVTQSPRKAKTWRKGERRTLRVRTTNELMQEWEAVAKAPGSKSDGLDSTTVLDLRGPQARVHASLTEVNTSASPNDCSSRQSAEQAGMLPELRHNIRMLVGLAEVDLKKQYRRLRAEKDALRQYTDKLDAHESAAKQTIARLESLEEVRAALSRCVDRAAMIRRRLRIANISANGAAADPAPDDEGVDVALSEWAALWDALRRAHPREWDEYALHEAAVSVAIPIFRARMAGWRPLSQPTLAVQLFMRWERALSGPITGTTESSAANNSFGALIFTVILPPIRSALANEWSARDVFAATELLGTWRPLFPSTVLGEIIAGQILPRLLREVSEWAPRPSLRELDYDGSVVVANSNALHTWLLPWAPLLPAPGLRMLFPQVRHRLASALAELPPGAPEAARAAAALVAPWRDIFDTHSWRALVMRSIIPKLSESMIGFEVNPAEQNLSPLRALFAWSEHIPNGLVSQLTLRFFFPRWLYTLHEWLSQSADFDEVGHWYSGWKSFLRRGAPALLHDSAVIEMLNQALDLLNAALDGRLPPLPVDPSINIVQPNMDTSFTWSGDADEDEADAPPPPPPDSAPARLHPHDAAGQHEAGPRRARADGEPTLREMLEQLASSQDIIFMPLSARHEGKQIFSFGGVNVYLDTDKELVYARHGDIKGFRPTNLRQLVGIARERQHT
mmetsp:Transcript_29930/g.91847  ORF Transcript_29930/g.91847 Transcript_29930/m.91847 type:complete len:750 (-) Transcript_29930:193-2442(-)